MGACNGKPATRSSNPNNPAPPVATAAANEPEHKQLYKFPSIETDHASGAPALPVASTAAGGGSKAPTAAAGGGGGAGPSKAKSTDAQVHENIQRKELSKKLRVGRNVQGDQFNVEDLMEDFKPKVLPKGAADAAAIRESLHGHFLFSSLTPKQLEVVVDAMEVERIPAGHILIQEGTEGKKFYVVKEGEFTVLVNTLRAEDGLFSLAQGKEVKTLGVGSNFGELALMYDCPRTATIVAKTAAQVFALDRQTFKTCVLVTGERETRDQIGTLKAVDLFSTLPEEVLDTISRAMLRHKVDAGSAVITEGEEGSVFYIIESGELETTIGGKFIRIMGPGDFFGERALLNNEPRSATVKAKTEGVLLALQRKDFEALLGPLEGLAERMQQVHAIRIKGQSAAATAGAAAGGHKDGSAGGSGSDGGTADGDAAADGAGDPHEQALRLSFRAVPISDLVIIKDVGRGAFGRVKVVRHKDTHALYVRRLYVFFQSWSCNKIVQFMRFFLSFWENTGHRLMGGGCVRACRRAVPCRVASRRVVSSLGACLPARTHACMPPDSGTRSR
jgi:cAMP-dependent protein kinase regulator